MAAKTLARLAKWRGHLGLVGSLLQIAEPLELAERGQGGQIDRAGDLVDVAVVEVERRAVWSWARNPSSARSAISRRTAAPHFRWRRVSWIVESRLLLTSVSWIVRSLLRVTRKADRAGDPEAAEQGIEPGADHVLEHHEPALAVALVGQGDQAVQDRGDLEHRVELPGRVLADRLDPQDQVEALVVQVRERVRRVDRQRGQDRVDLGIEIVVEVSVLRGA